MARRRSCGAILPSSTRTSEPRIDARGRDRARNPVTMPRYLPIAVLGGLLAAGLVAPLATGQAVPGFWVEVLIGGLMAGVLYSLVALGFVLIFKASGVFNFAQG